MWRLGPVVLMIAALTAPARADDDSLDGSQPNFVVFFADNLGYGDIGPFGSTLHRTPNLDAVAAAGMKLTHFYVTSGVCTPSRASLMTGCYPRRVGLHQSDTGGRVLQPVSAAGLHPDEITIARLLKDAGYATAAIGKWHLGDQPPFLPTRHGFDHYWGVPYSDDMTPREGRPWPDLPLMRNEQVIEAPVDRDYLTQRETAEAIRFIEANRDRPFFLYIPHAMPGSTRAPFASPDFKGKSQNGPWGDSIEELDWSAGQIIETLERLQLDQKTLVIWTSDNGAPRRNPPQGSNSPLGGWGYTTAEGGQRVPTLAHWPGRIPAGSVCDQLATTMDLYVTLARLAGAPLPEERIIDGQDILDLLLDRPGAVTPYDAFFYYDGPQLQAVRGGPWKLYLPLENKLRSRGDDRSQPAQLYNVVDDPGESDDVIDDHPDVVQRLTEHAEAAREDLGDLDRPGQGQRPAGRVDHPTPRTLPAN